MDSSPSGTEIFRSSNPEFSSTEVTTNNSNDEVKLMESEPAAAINSKQPQIGPDGDFKLPSATNEDEQCRNHSETETSKGTRSSHNTGLGSAAICSISSMEPAVKDAANGLQSGCLQWTQVFTESENFETFCPTRVDKLLEEAKALEENLLHQKERLMQRLRVLTRTLQEV